jgi:parvulin-like peptidyl-prolyl isomerase
MRVFRWCVVILGAAAVAAAGERWVLETILVRVNDRIVTSSDFAERLQQELSQFSNPPQGDELRQFAQRLFDDLVSEMILLERASERQVVVDDATVDRAIEALREDNELHDDAAFQEALEASGVTEAQLRDRYRQTIMLQRAVQGEVKPTEITEEEVRRQYERDLEMYRVPEKIELEQMYFPLAEDGSDRDTVLRRVQGLLGRVRDGADLKAEATLAGVELQELGAIPLADLRPELRQAVEDVAAGALTEPLTAPGGVQILRVVERIPAGYQPFEDVREAIRRRLSEEAYQRQTGGLVDRLKEKYLVEVHSDRIAAVIDQIGAAG